MIVLLQELVLPLGSLVRDHLRVQLGFQPSLLLCQIPAKKSTKVTGVKGQGSKILNIYVLTTHGLAFYVASVLLALD